MDVADDAKISPQQSAGSVSPAAALSGLAKPESLPVKKVVEADDEGNDTWSTPKSLVVAGLPDSPVNRPLHSASRGASRRQKGNMASRHDVRKAPTPPR